MSRLPRISCNCLQSNVPAAVICNRHRPQTFLICTKPKPKDGSKRVPTSCRDTGKQRGLHPERIPAVSFTWVQFCDVSFRRNELLAPSPQPGNLVPRSRCCLCRRSLCGHCADLPRLAQPLDGPAVLSTSCDRDGFGAALLSCYSLKL